MSKLLNSIKEAVQQVGLKDGMTISFHHHMRNGDFVLNMVLEAIAELGFKNLTVNASSVFDVHEPLIGHIKNGVITGLECNYMGGKVGKAIVMISKAVVRIRAHPTSMSLSSPLPPPTTWATAPVSTASRPAVPSAMPLPTL